MFLIEFEQADVEKEYPRLIGDEVDGLKVIRPVHNMDSISSSYGEYEYYILPGVRVVTMDPREFKPYSADEKKRCLALAEQIKKSGQITPLIVVTSEKDIHDYGILEGSHRFEAIGLLKKKEFPAIVVVTI